MLPYNRASSRYSEWENPQMRHAIIVKCLFFLLEISKLIFYYIFIAQPLLLSISQLKVTSIVFYTWEILHHFFIVLDFIFSPFLFHSLTLSLVLLYCLFTAAAAISHNLPFWLLQHNSFAQQLSIAPFISHICVLSPLEIIFI